MSRELVWGLPVALYLFVGGMSAAAFYVGVFADLFSRGKLRDIARLSSYVVLIPTVIGLLMLVIDLGQPLRFWHLMFQFNPTTRIVFEPGSVMSWGVWILVIFSCLCGVAYPLFWLAEEKFARNLPVLPALAGREKLRKTLGVLGLPFAMGVGAYTGVLLSATSVPVWATTPILPVLFTVSATSTGLAAILVMMVLTKHDDHDAMGKIEKGDNALILIEIAVVMVLVIALFLAAPWTDALQNLLVGKYAVFFWIGFIFTGLILPLFIQRYSLKKPHAGTGLVLAGALLVLFGGFFLRYIMLLAV
ncbi:polysulfide reductase NrfD [Thermincola ferriacetica]|uniref:Polysulfide reductase NrfD n=1 Tax=Thermincola ferriacetica TaxID=281456 RepID=A0A0L6W0A4_9FIRM|nr:NrfD/PsrC family molybdoenzyme membrane anchor subunit [Thermincola ferriacetica]KNZ69002.1 polysulfide reductase NrfD [Thermincola ferriacetica]